MIDTESVLMQAIAEYGVEAQIRQCMEECAELTAALNKYLRITAGGQTAYKPSGKPMTKEEAERNILGEIADVSIMLNQMEIIFGDSSLNVIGKIMRLANRLGIDEDTTAGGLMSAT